MAVEMQIWDEDKVTSGSWTLRHANATKVAAMPVPAPHGCGKELNDELARI
jgi:hypothetical protein